MRPNAERSNPVAWYIVPFHHKQADVRAMSSAGLTALHCLGQANEERYNSNSNSDVVCKTPARRESISALDTKALMSGDDIAGQDNQCTMPIERSTLAIAELLVGAEAEMHAVDDEGNTPLLTAARRGKWALCKLLLSSGADASHR